MRLIAITAIMLATLSSAYAQFSRPAPGPIALKIQAAMQSEVRSDADRARDENRKPVETLEFFGLKDDMRVLELVPEGGWYTKILAPVLADKGQLYLAIGTRQLG
ncbi:MAG TPA: methyltransferase, partial [Chromatiales bacterium]|nr:methyltransferase [Chromatiales bacterium]